MSNKLIWQRVQHMSVAQIADEVRGEFSRSRRSDWRPESDGYGNVFWVRQALCGVFTITAGASGTRFRDFPNTPTAPLSFVPFGDGKPEVRRIMDSFIPVSTWKLDEMTKRYFPDGLFDLSGRKVVQSNIHGNPLVVIDHPHGVVFNAGNALMWTHPAQEPVPSNSYNKDMPSWQFIETYWSVPCHVACQRIKQRVAPLVDLARLHQLTDPWPHGTNREAVTYVSPTFKGFRRGRHDPSDLLQSCAEAAAPSLAEYKHNRALAVSLAYSLVTFTLLEFLELWTEVAATEEFCSRLGHTKLLLCPPRYPADISTLTC